MCGDKKMPLHRPVGREIKGWEYHSIILFSYLIVVIAPVTMQMFYIVLHILEGVVYTFFLEYSEHACNL